MSRVLGCLAHPPPIWPKPSLLSLTSGLQRGRSLLSRAGQRQAGGAVRAGALGGLAERGSVLCGGGVGSRVVVKKTESGVDRTTIYSLRWGTHILHPEGTPTCDGARGSAGGRLLLMQLDGSCLRLLGGGAVQGAGGRAGDLQLHLEHGMVGRGLAGVRALLTPEECEVAAALGGLARRGERGGGRAGEERRRQVRGLRRWRQCAACPTPVRLRTMALPSGWKHPEATA